ncbi:MAG TPA: hypothetical protein VFX41_08365 [Actinomycetales bacterium]|nr:hypothetical protein [Actinomycetales bacterium]
MSAVGALERHEWRALLGIALVGGYVTALLALSNRVGYDVWAGLVIGPVLLVTGILVLRRSAQKLDDRWLFQVAVIALVTKLAAAMVRYLVAEVVYGSSDATEYDAVGRKMALAYRSLMFTAPEERRNLVGTAFVMALTAALYAITGPTMVGGYLVFAFGGFWGCYLTYLGLRRAVPGAAHRRYAVLVLFLPTLLYWPSSLGKDAWMQLWIGVALYGAALIFTHSVRGVAVMALGLAGAAMVRPHIAGLLFGAFVVAVVIRRSRRQTQLTPILRVGVLTALVVLGALLMQRVAVFTGQEEVSATAITDAVTATGVHTSQGGSEFTPVPLSSPVGVPMALLTVLFRPVPFEAHNAQALLASVEGLLLLWLTWHYRGSLVTSLRSVRDHPFVTMCLAYTVLFSLAFSSFSNFGILTRQRAQVLLAFLVLLCLTPATRRRRNQPDPDEVPAVMATAFTTNTKGERQ